MTGRADHALLAVRVKPRARHAEIVGRHGDGIKVAVRAAPERGRANDELIGLLAEALSLPRGALEIASGAGSQDKKIRIHGSPEDLRDRVQRLLDALD